MTTFDVDAGGTGSVTVTDGGTTTVVVDPRVEAILRAERLAAEATRAEDLASEAARRLAVIREVQQETDLRIARISAEKAALTDDISSQLRSLDEAHAIGAMQSEDYARITEALRADLLRIEDAYRTDLQQAEVQKAVVSRDVEIAQVEAATTEANALAARSAAELAAAEAACFCAGTLIATPEGERPVETLAIGDRVLTADGTAREVRWIGRQTIAAAFADPLRALPVRIAAGALGNGLPRRDLTLSPDHALLVDGVLVQAGALVDGLLVTRLADPGPRFTYFHVELEDQSLILAEGVPAETFVDNVTRERFDNFAEFVALYGETGPTIDELALPRVKSARQLPRALGDRLADRAAKLLGLAAAT